MVVVDMVTLIVLLLLLCLDSSYSWIPIPRCSSTPPATEIIALEALYNATNGAQWLWKSPSFGKVWSFTEGCNPCDNWQGVLCTPQLLNNNSNCVLFLLQLDGYHLQGSLPNSIGDLQHLYYLQLSSNTQLTGKVPDSIGHSMQQLISLELNSNALTGSFPLSLTNLSSLHLLYLFENQFYGHLPAELVNMQNLTELDLDSNAFSGSFPLALTQLQKLNYLFIFDNLLAGTLPDAIGNMTVLWEFGLHFNLLSGALPSTLCKLAQLQTIYLYNNLLQGTLPDCMSDLIELEELEMDYNFLTGRLPESLGQLTNLSLLRVSTNAFTGRIVQLPVTMKQLDLSSNYFSGDVGWLGELPKAVAIVLSKNFFAGTLPTAPQLSSSLLYFQLQSNLFSGTIDNLLQPELQSQLELIDLSKNSFVGSIPETLFQFPKLMYLVLAQNCFEGRLPDTVCAPNATLDVLALDGLHAASSCEQRLFPAIPQIHTLANPMAMLGTVPRCLFADMQQLTILHLAGNGFTGSLPNGGEISAKLTQLSLSHNALTGSLSAVFQHHGFTTLDLSFNKLTGALHNDFNISGYQSVAIANQSASSTTTGLSLHHNRLSGSIPSVLLDVLSIDILAGNMFSCEIGNRWHTLPSHDDAFHTYMCGSDETDMTLICYVVVLSAVCLAALAVTMLMSQESVQSTSMWKYWNDLYDLATKKQSVDSGNPEEVAVRVLLAYFQSLQWNICRLSCGIVVVFCIVYGVLGWLYSSFLHKYVWTISIGYLSGLTPAAVLLVFLLCSLLWLFYEDSPGWAVLAPVVPLSEAQQEPDKLNSPEDSKAKDDAGYRWKVWLLVMVLVNGVLVMTINSSYVSLIISGISTTEQVILTIAMSLFKDGWRLLVLRTMEWDVMRAMESQWGAESVSSLLLLICLFNNIVAPCLSTAMVNTSCFYYSIIPAATVEYTSDSISFCSSFYDNGVCASYETINISTSYPPTFTYSNQCTSTLLTIFVPVWIYMFLFGSIVAPLMTWGLWISSQLRRDAVTDTATIRSSAVAQDFNVLTLAREQILSYWYGTTLHPLWRLDDYKKHVVILCNNIAIVLCFGVLFPPLAIVGCIAVVWQLTMQKLFILLMLTAPSTSSEQKELIQTQIRQTAKWFPITYVHTVKNLVLYVSVIWGLFLWDILSDVRGVWPSVWIMAIVFCVGLALRLQYLLRPAGSLKTTLSTNPAVEIELRAVLDEAAASELETAEEIRNPVHPSPEQV